MRACTRSRAGRSSASSASRMSRGLQRIVALGEPGDRRALPAQRAVGGEDEVGIGGGRHLLGALGDLAGERLLGRGAERLGVRPVGVGVRREAEAVEAADMLAFDQHVAGRRDLGFEHRVLFQPPHQHAGPPVDEAARSGAHAAHRTDDPLSRASAPANGAGSRSQLRPVGGKGPGADVGDAVGEGVDVAVGAVGIGDLAARTSRRRSTPSRARKPKSVVDQLGVVGRRDLAVVGDLADVPEQRDALAAVGERARSSSSRADHVEDVDVVRRRRLGQALARRRQVEARLERGERWRSRDRGCATGRSSPARSGASRAPRPARPRRDRRGW